MLWQTFFTTPTTIYSIFENRKHHQNHCPVFLKERLDYSNFQATTAAATIQQQQQPLFNCWQTVFTTTTWSILRWEDKSRCVRHYFFYLSENLLLYPSLSLTHTQKHSLSLTPRLSLSLSLSLYFTIFFLFNLSLSLFHF